MNPDEAYIELCFNISKGSFMRKLKFFIETDSTTADRIQKSNRSLLLLIKQIPNKRRRAIETYNLEELSCYVDTFFKIQSKKRMFPY